MLLNAFSESRVNGEQILRDVSHFLFPGQLFASP